MNVRIMVRALQLSSLAAAAVSALWIAALRIPRRREDESLPGWEFQHGMAVWGNVILLGIVALQFAVELPSLSRNDFPSAPDYPKPIAWSVAVASGWGWGRVDHDNWRQFFCSPRYVGKSDRSEPIGNDCHECRDARKHFAELGLPHAHVWRGWGGELWPQLCPILMELRSVGRHRRRPGRGCWP